MVVDSVNGTCRVVYVFVFRMEKVGLCVRVWVGRRRSYSLWLSFDGDDSIIVLGL